MHSKKKVSAGGELIDVAVAELTAALIRLAITEPKAGAPAEVRLERIAALEQTKIAVAAAVHAERVAFVRSRARAYLAQIDAGGPDRAVSGRGGP